MSKYKILKEYEQVLMTLENIIGSGSTDNEQLDKLGSYIFGKDYLGTLCSDQMPKYIKNDQCFILNTESSKSKTNGVHWVGFYKLNNKLFYYDSFSRSKTELSKYWKNKKMYNANTNDVDQAVTEQNCGTRSFAFLILMRKFGEKIIGII